MDTSARRIERTGWLSVAVNVVLIALNAAIAFLTGSLAVTAEAVHNLVDFLSALAVVIGVKLSQRRSKKFPYGLYKVENLVAVMMSLLIFFSGYEIARAAFSSAPRELLIHPLMVGGVIASMVLPLAFSRYEMHVGRETNSPSLIADAQEYRVHVFSSGVVLLAFLSQMGGLQVDRWAALVVVMFVAKMGWDLLVDGMRVLLDASLDSQTMARVRRILEEEPLVAAVRSLTGRNAGRFRFIESEITLRTRDLEIAHLASDRLETRIRAALTNVDRVLIHYDLALRTHLRCGVPLESRAGRVSEHFGEAPYFAVLTIRTADGVLERQEIHANPFVHVPKAKGIRVAEWLVANKTDVVFTKEVLKGKGPEYMLGSTGVELCLTTASRLDDVVPALRDRLGGISP